MKKEFAFSIRIRLCAGDKFFGPGTVTLLENVDKMHSLLAASKLMSMSYSKAIAMVKNAEKHLGVRLLISKTGGESGGGSELTQNARTVISLYSDFASSVQASANEYFKALDEGLQKLPPEELS